jgi:hypothetical protein
VKNKNKLKSRSAPTRRVHKMRSIPKLQQKCPVWIYSQSPCPSCIYPLKFCICTRKKFGGHIKVTYSIQCIGRPIGHPTLQLPYWFTGAVYRRKLIHNIVLTKESTSWHGRVFTWLTSWQILLLSFPLSKSLLAYLLSPSFSGSFIFIFVLLNIVLSSMISTPDCLFWVKLWVSVL